VLRERNVKNWIDVGVASDLSHGESLAQAFQGCDAVAHCAGINR